MSLPRLLSVVHVPLVAKSNDTLVGTSTDDLTLRLGVGESKLGLNHLVTNLVLGLLDRLTLVRADKHGTVVEAFLVSKLLGLGKLVLVLGTLDLELLAERLGGHVTVSRGVDDGDGVKGSPLRVDLVVLRLLAEVHERSIIIGRVGRHRSDDTGTLVARTVSMGRT